MSAKASSHRLMLALILALAAAFVWSAAAYAVTPEDVQYGSPTSSVGGATGTGGPGTGGSAGYAGDSLGSVGAASETGSGSSSASIGFTGLLPETGGPLLSLVALGSAALIGTGLILFRYRPKSD